MPASAQRRPGWVSRRELLAAEAGAYGRAARPRHPAAGWLRRRPGEAAWWSEQPAASAWAWLALLLVPDQEPAFPRRADPFARLEAVRPVAQRSAELPLTEQRASVSPREAAAAGYGPAARRRSREVLRSEPASAPCAVQPMAAVEAVPPGAQERPPGAAEAEPSEQPRAAAVAAPAWFAVEEAEALRAAAEAEVAQPRAAVLADAELLPAAALRGELPDALARQRAEHPWRAAASTCPAPAWSALAPIRLARSAPAMARWRIALP